MEQNNREVCKCDEKIQTGNKSRGKNHTLPAKETLFSEAGFLPCSKSLSTGNVSFSLCYHVPNLQFMNLPVFKERACTLFNRHKLALH